jgi:ornithine cyclodeaminase/alanine dehydrogenase-like protein (mu-crystallin family)
MPLVAPDDITLFKSLGIALWDVAVTGAAYRKAVQLGVGQKVP